MAREIADDSLEAWKEARDAVSKLTNEVLEEEGFDAFLDMQETLFELQAGVRARDPEFQDVNLPGTRINIPSSDRVVGDNPSVSDEHGEWVVPTKHREFRVLDDLRVTRPDGSPYTEHAVSVDHVITPEGEVRPEVNAVPLDEVGRKQGSHIR